MRLNSPFGWLAELSVLDVAIADIATVVSKLGGRTSAGVQARADGTIHTRLQQVFVRQHGDWSIAAYHNVDVKEP